MVVYQFILLCLHGHVTSRSELLLNLLLQPPYTAIFFTFMMLVKSILHIWGRQKFGSYPTNQWNFFIGVIVVVRVVVAACSCTEVCRGKWIIDIARTMSQIDMSRENVLHSFHHCLDCLQDCIASVLSFFLWMIPTLKVLSNLFHKILCCDHLYINNIRSNMELHNWRIVSRVHHELVRNFSGKARILL